MNDQPILQSIEPDFLKKPSSRRDALCRLGKLGGVSLTAPVILAAMAGPAHGANMSPGVFSVLRFALLLERLENDFYKKALDAPGLIPARHRRVFEQISKHETDHVALLATATGHIIETDEFDFTGHGRFPDVFRNYHTFLALSETFEDTGVRAYKGQAPNLMPVGLLLAIALKIHSVEARHAAEVRRIRGEKAWISGSSRGSLPAAAQGSYNGEGATTQAGVHLSGAAASEAFDEPLTKQQVLAAVSPFVVKSSVLHS